MYSQFSLDFFTSDSEHILYSCVTAVFLGYRLSLFSFFIGIIIRILFAKHYNIEELFKVSLIRMITFGLLLAGPCSSFFLPVSPILFIQILCFLLITLLIDYILSYIVLRTYSKKIVFKFVLFSNLVPLLLAIIYLFAIPFLQYLICRI